MALVVALDLCADMRDVLIGVMALAYLLAVWLFAWSVVYVPLLLVAWTGSSAWAWLYALEALVALHWLGRWIRLL